MEFLIEFEHSTLETRKKRSILAASFFFLDLFTTNERKLTTLKFQNSCLFIQKWNQNNLVSFYLDK